MTITVTVLYFASLADKAKKGSESLTLDASTNLNEVYQMLQQKYGFELESSDIRVAINDEFASWRDDIKDADAIAFIPPVAGG